MLRIALLQLVSCGRDTDANLRKGETFCRRAASGGAHIALFPEMWNIGYQAFDPDDPIDRESWLSLAVEREGAFVQRFGDLARELGIAIGVTYLERWPGRPRDTVTLFDCRGQEALTYAKVHLGPWDPPDNACTPGDAFPVVTIATPAGALRIGFMICFDREFPEAARMLMLNGAEVILTPNACELDDEDFGDVRIGQFRARAFENLVAVAMANYAAPQNDGNSVAFYPDGALIVRAGSAEGVVFADVDLDRVRAFRRREVGRDGARSPEKYAAISSAEHPRPLYGQVGAQPNNVLQPKRA
jgi:predicted amidohydrolase